MRIALSYTAIVWCIALAIWIAFAVVVWNVVLDQVIVLAGRRYVVAAIAAAQGSGPYARLDDWMRPAVARGFWYATPPPR